MQATHVPHAIIAARGQGFKREFLISWLGFKTLRTATWEPKFDDHGRLTFDKFLETDYEEDEGLQLEKANCVSAYKFLCSMDTKRPTTKILKARLTRIGIFKPNG